MLSRALQVTADAVDDAACLRAGEPVAGSATRRGRCVPAGSVSRTMISVASCVPMFVDDDGVGLGAARRDEVRPRGCCA